MMSPTLSRVLDQLGERLRFPQLFLLTLGILILDLFIPDMIPYVDELLLGLLTMLFGFWRKKRQAARVHGEQGTDRP